MTPRTALKPTPPAAPTSIQAMPVSFASAPASASASPMPMPLPLARSAFKPYAHVVDYLLDLAREQQAALGLARCERALLHGEAPSKDAEAYVLDAETLRDLALGKAFTMRGAQLSVAILAARAELPLDQWAQLAAATAKVRHERTAATPPGHPCHELARYESLLPPFEARAAGLLLCHHLGGYLDKAIARAGVEFYSWLEIGQMLTLLCADPVAAHDLLLAFDALDSPLYRHGVCELPEGGERSVEVRRRDLVPSRSFLHECLGVPFEALGAREGVQVSRPTTTLDDVVLEPELMESVRRIDLDAARRQRQSQALGILLHGPSGTGKTLLAQAIAGSGKRALLSVDASRLRRREDLVRVLAGLLRQTATQDAVLFIDEADDLLLQGNDASRVLLTGMECHPAVVLLASNQPYRLDPALDRRLQIKLCIGMPGARQRAEILRLELIRQGHAVDPGLARGAALARLAETFRFSGGYLRNVVQMAALSAGLRRGGHGAITADDLSSAALRQVKLLDDRIHTGCAWAERLTPLGAGLHGPTRAAEISALASALDEVRAQNATQERPGLGVLLLITGPERQLAREAAEGLAHALRLPLALMHAQPPSRDDPSSRPRVPSAWLRDLGEMAACLLHGDADDLEDWLPSLLRVPTSRHLVVLHLTGATAPAALRRVIAIERPWATLDGDSRAAAWDRIGGEGPAPEVRTLGELHCAHARNRLSALGVPSSTGAEALP